MQTVSRTGRRIDRPGYSAPFVLTVTLAWTLPVLAQRPAPTARSRLA